MSDSDASIVFPSYGLDEPIYSALRITQEEYRHDIAVYDVPIRRKERDIYNSGNPITISWRADRDQATFHGYVHHTEPAGSPTDPSMRVFCKGASQTFEGASQGVYKKRTVPGVAGEIARKFNFDAEIVPHAQVMSAMSATGTRFWDFLVGRSKDIGYSFYCTNTRMQMHPRLYYVEKYLPQAPLLEMGDDGERGTLHTFEPVDGNAPPGKQRAYVSITGVDPRSGKFFGATAGPAFSKLGKRMAVPAGDLVDSHTVSSDPQDARWSLLARAERDRFNVWATALADGHPLLHQTWPVILGNVDDRYEGTWFVRKVTHIMGYETDYLMELHLGRDATGSLAPLPDPRARRVVATRANPQGRPKAAYPASVLSGTTWKSAWSTASRTFPS